MHQTEHSESLDFILANIGHLHRARVHQLFEALGLYHGQPPVLFELWKKEGMTQSELAARLQITPATMTRMLQRMQKTGFICRQPDPDDQRISRVFLSPAGRAVKSQVETVWQTLETETFANLSAAEKELLRRMLLQLRSNLFQVTGEEPWK